jgi:hypothetical protein
VILGPNQRRVHQQHFTIQGLTNLISPSSTLGFILIYDHTTGTQKTNAYRGPLWQVNIRSRLARLLATAPLAAFFGSLSIALSWLG